MSDDVKFESGAKRSAIMPYYAAIPYSSLRRVALRATGAPEGHKITDSGFEYEGGSRKYGYGNWARGLPMEDTLNHVLEHLLRWKASIEEGQVPVDDHLSAAAWGILLPLMRFEHLYAYQWDIRNRLLEGGQTAEQIDAAVRRQTTLLIQPLAPE